MTELAKVISEKDKEAIQLVYEIANHKLIPKLLPYGRKILSYFHEKYPNYDFSLCELRFQFREELKSLESDNFKDRLAVLEHFEVEFVTDACPLLLEYLPKEKHPWVISKLTKVTGILGAPYDNDAVLEALIPFLLHEDDRIRANTIEGIGGLQSERKTPVLVRMLMLDPSERVQEKAAIAISFGDISRAMEYIRPFLESQHTGDNELAWNRLKLFDDPAAKNLLQEYETILAERKRNTEELRARYAAERGLSLEETPLELELEESYIPSFEEVLLRNGVDFTVLEELPVEVYSETVEPAVEELTSVDSAQNLEVLQKLSNDIRNWFVQFSNNLRQEIRENYKNVQANEVPTSLKLEEMDFSGLQEKIADRIAQSVSLEEIQSRIEDIRSFQEQTQDTLTVLKQEIHLSGSSTGEESSIELSTLQTRLQEMRRDIRKMSVKLLRKQGKANLSLPDLESMFSQLFSQTMSSTSSEFRMILDSLNQMLEHSRMEFQELHQDMNHILAQQSQWKEQLSAYPGNPQISYNPEHQPSLKKRSVILPVLAGMGLAAAGFMVFLKSDFIRFPSSIKTVTQQQKKKTVQLTRKSSAEISENAVKQTETKISDPIQQEKIVQFVASSDLTHKKEVLSVNQGDYTGDIKSGRYHGRGQLKYPNGEYYIGDFADGVFSGFGEYHWVDGEIYKGNWKNGLRDGEGEFSWPNGQKYTGNYVGGVREGIGKLVWSNGDSYTGNWKNDLFHGQGTLIRLSELQYKGMFKSGLYDGKGILTTNEGTRYEGEFLSGQKHGNGIIVFSNGEAYEGHFVEEEFEGSGKYSWPSGDRYEGYWLAGAMHGTGKFLWADGTIYLGNFTNGVMEGRGKMSFPDGSYYKGEFKDGIREGAGLFVSASGIRYEGLWKDGRRSGKGVQHWPSGERYEGDFSYDAPDGMGQFEWPAGHRYAGQWKAGKRQGLGTYITSDGQKFIGYWYKNHYVGRIWDRALLESLSPEDIVKVSNYSQTNSQSMGLFTDLLTKSE
jgi:HEAT repeat protein